MYLSAMLSPISDYDHAMSQVLPPLLTLHFPPCIERTPALTCQPSSDQELRLSLRSPVQSALQLPATGRKLF